MTSDEKTSHKRLSFTTLCDLFIYADLWWVWATQPNTNTHCLLAAQQLYLAPELLYFYTGMTAVWWSLSWVISNVCPDKSLILSLEVIKPLLSTSSKLLHIPPSLLSQRHGKSDMHVCVRMWFSVIFYCKCFWAEDTAPSCRRQITPDLEKRLELGKRGTEPSLHPGFAHTL